MIHPASLTHDRSFVRTTLRGGSAPDVGVSDLIQESFEWTSNLGAPAALVAGAVIATMYENMRSGDLELRSTDSKTSRTLKKLTRYLLMSAFGLEIVCIFVTTVTGTVLMSRDLDFMDAVEPVGKATTPLSFLKGNFEFEYLTARISMLQGLLHWLLAIAINHLIPDDDVPTGSEMFYMNKFIGWSLLSTVTMMVAFYNKHMTFYAHYWEMLNRWLSVTMQRFFWTPRPLGVVYIPALFYTVYLGYKAFAAHSDIEKRKST